MPDVEKAMYFQWMKKQKPLLSPEEREKGIVWEGRVIL